MKRHRSKSSAGDDARIRLACSNCDRSDRDGITEAELSKCRQEGWTEIDFIQTYEQSVATHENPAAAPPGFDVTAWYTHLGLCPECKAEATDANED